MNRSRGMLAALRYPDFRRLASSAAVSKVGDWLYNVALAVYVYDRTHSAAWIGAITLLRLAPYVLFAPIGGVIADRYERRTVLIVSDVLRTAIMAMLAVAVAAKAPVLLVGLLAFATTAAGTSYMPAVFALVPDVVGEDDLASANSLDSVIECTAIVVGPALGAVVLAATTTVWSFVINAATFAVGALISTTIRARSRAKAAANETLDGSAARFRAELADGARVVRDDGEVRVLMSLGIAAAFTYGVQTVVLVLLVSERVGHDAGNVGYLYGALGVGGLIGAPIASRLAHHARLGGVAFGALVVLAASLVALIPVHVAAVAAALVVVSGASNVIVDVISTTLLQRDLDREIIGRVFGIYDALVVAAMILGSLLVAPLRAGFGFAGMLIIVGVLTPLLVLAQFRDLVKADRDSAFEWAHLSRTVTDLRRVRLFANLRAAALERLAQDATKERFAVGETIVVKGEEARACYTVLHGEVAVREGGPTSSIITTLNEDDFFGEIGLLHHTARTASVTAATDCVLYRIDAETFARALDADASVGAVAFEAAGARLSATAARS